MSLPIAILAGGLATRLRPITNQIPKALVPIAGVPFLTHQIHLLKSQGINEIVLCVGHLGEMIQEQYGNGEKFDIKISYSFDGEQPLGTGGAIAKALPMLGERFFVLYGDSYLPIDYQAIAQAHIAAQKLGLMTVFENEGKWDTSNIWFEKGVIKAYDKKNLLPQMRFIDYGLSVFHRNAFRSASQKKSFDLSELFQDLIVKNELAGYVVAQRFYEIGSHSGLKELDQLLKNKS
ncbi:MAG: nucleotidyltransferase family protein [Verrucomicrobiia bacterium]